MTRKQFENYKFSKNTQVKFKGQWSNITEVRFWEGKIGIKKPLYLAEYSEIEDVDNNP
jgi:hypothetical protein